MSTDDHLAEYEVGQKLGKYEVTRKEPLDHLHATYYELVHSVTGARHIHIAAPDDNNLFNVLFPTVPRDSTGVAHVLEHCVLTGSERYPVRDPFFSMMPRSLKTFMNAMTSSDWTTYPMSTRNKKDFFNLLSVYLDAVFFPKLEEQAFRQEGHRLEFEVLEDPNSGLKFKGIVFNEMKGSMASPPQVMYKAIGEALYPDLTYAQNSGGDPERIPDLTWEQLREFHTHHYHPSNGWFFTYGNIPLEETLREIEDKALVRFERREVDVTIPDQKRFETPRQYRKTYALSRDEDPSKKSQCLIAWLTTHMGDSFGLLSLGVLKEVLLGNPAAPLHKALISSGLGDDLADVTGFHPFFREVPFGAGLKNIDEADAGKVEAIVLETLESLVRDGVDPELVDSVVHQLEIEQREISNAIHPHALKVFFQLSGAYVYGGDPYRALQFDRDLERLQKERSEGRFFEDLIRRHLLDNPHRVRIVLAPDQNLEEQKAESELARLAEIEKQFSDDEKRRIVEETRRLKEEQEAEQDLSVLPTLELSDVPMEFEDVAHTIETVAGAKVVLFPQPTNGITYIDVRADYGTLPDRLKDRLSLFAYAVPKMGAGDDDYLAMAARIEMYTGGVGLRAGVRPLAGGSSFLMPLIFSGKSLVRNHEPFLDILKDFLASVRFEPQRLREVIAQLAAERESTVVRAGTQYSISLASSKILPAGLMDERLDGITALRALKDLVKKGDALDEVIGDLEAIRDHAFRNQGLQVCVTSEEKHFGEIRNLLEQTLSALPAEAAAGEDRIPQPPGARHEARTISAPVAFNAKVFPAVAYPHDDAPALAVLGGYLKENFLHREIREKGGAYGSMSRYEREQGTFVFGSYRDPNIVRTYEVFDSAVTEVQKGEIDPDKLKEAILSACGEVDPLQSPDTKGRQRFSNDIAGYTLEIQEEFKKGLLAVKEADLRRVAETYLSGDSAVLATLAGASMMEEANKQMGEIFEVSPLT